MHKHRGILAVLTAAVLASFSAAAVFFVLTPRLPDPASADTSGLLRWLVLCDLADEPEEVRSALVDRLESLLQQPTDFAETPELTDQQHQRLSANALILRRVWLDQKVALYHRCPPAGQGEFLDRQIEAIDRWSAVLARLGNRATNPAEDPAKAPAADGLVGLMNEIRHWVADAQGQRYQRITQALQAGMLRWLAIRDLADESFATRLALADTLLEEIPQDFDAQSVESGMNAVQRKQFHGNVQRLAQTVFIDRARTYHRTDSEQRPAYLDRQIEHIEKISRVLHSGGQSGNINLAENLSRWTEQAPPEDRPLMRRFQADLTGRMIWRAVRRLFTPG